MRGSIVLALLILALCSTETYANERYIARATLFNGSEKISISYSFKDTSLPTRVEWRVQNKAAQIVASGTLPPAPSGTLVWDGKAETRAIGDPTQVVPADNYVVEILSYLGGQTSVSETIRRDVTIYELKLNSPVVPGTNRIIALANNDDDDQNSRPDISDASTVENDLVELSLSVTPLTLSGLLEISSSNASPKFRLWSDSKKTERFLLAKKIPIRSGAEIPSLFLEGIGPANTDLTLRLVSEEGKLLEALTLDVTLLEINLMGNIDCSGAATAADISLPYARFGLWDNAFAASGTLLNNAADNQNFIGLDTRRFYYHLVDPGANNDSGLTESIPVGVFEWYTINRNGIPEDYRPTPTARSLSLIETGPNTASFISKPLMLVSDDLDLSVTTHTGSPTGGIATNGDANHRLRKARLDGAVRIRYRPLPAPSLALDHTIPVMCRAPDERRSLSVRIFNFSDHFKGVLATPQATIDEAIKEIGARYAIAGVSANVTYNVNTDQLDVGPQSSIDLTSVTSFDYSNPADWQTLTPSSDQQELINLVRSVEPSTTLNTNTMYIVFVPRLASNRGEAFPDTYIMNSPIQARNFVFVSGMTAGIYTAPHELGHLLIPPQTLAHVNGSEVGWAPGGHYGGDQDAHNLMRYGTTDTIAASPTIGDSRRLWNDALKHNVEQINRLRNSRFVN